MKQKGWAPIVIVVLIAILAVGGYLIYKLPRTSVTPPTPQTTPVPSPTLNPSPAPTGIDETTTWKTYTNKKLGVEFKYPSDWYLLELPDADLSVFLNDSPMKATQTDAPLGPIYIGLNVCMNTVTEQKYPCTKSITESVSNLQSIFSKDSLQIKEINISGKRGTQVYGIVTSGQPYEGVYMKQSFLPLNDYQILITLNRKDWDSIYAQILSTFKFLP